VTRGYLPQIPIFVSILVTELFQCFFSQFAKISNFHSSTLYNIKIIMSRKIHPDRKWGQILKQFREEAHLTQEELAQLMGFRKGKGKISETEKGKLPLTEERIRLWINKCGKTIFDFYTSAAIYEGGKSLLEIFKSITKF